VVCLRASHRIVPSLERSPQMHHSHVLNVGAHVDAPAYDMNGGPVSVLHGAPLRLRCENELGFKMVKWISTIEFVGDLGDLGAGQAATTRITSSMAIACRSDERRGSRQTLRGTEGSKAKSEGKHHVDETQSRRPRDLEFRGRSCQRPHHQDPHPGCGLRGYTHHASRADPQYEIKSDATAHIAMHKRAALTKALRGARR
jgi:hypothetical protein